jgi:hypothetical protein
VKDSKLVSSNVPSRSNSNVRDIGTLAGQARYT